MQGVIEENPSKSFTVFYDSESEESPLSHHQMDIDDLTLALEGMRDVLKAANTVLNGDESELKVRVNAFEEGSFGVLFELLSAPGAVDILKSGLLHLVVFLPKEWLWK